MDWVSTNYMKLDCAKPMQTYKPKGIPHKFTVLFYREGKFPRMSELPAVRDFSEVFLGLPPERKEK
jgi:hypothetical protein